jgi:hypothetical protein
VKNGRNIVIFTLFFILTLNILSGDPIIGMSTNTLRKNGFMLEGHFFYSDFTKRYDFSSEEYVPFPSDHKYTIIGFLPEGYYGILDVLTLHLAVPVTMHERDYGTSEKATGLGDVYADLKYRLLEGGYLTPMISFFAGGRFPTGDKDKIPPLGDGSMDFVGGLLLSEYLPMVATHLGIGFWYNGSVDDVDIPDILFYNGTIEYPFFPQFTVLCEADGFISVSGDEQTHSLEICPGVRNSTFPGLDIEVSLKVPLKTRMALRYDFYPFVGCAYTF